MKPKDNYRRSSLMTPSSVARRRRQKKKVESGGMKLPENFHHQKEENRAISGKISLFPNPNTINNFMMAIDDHMRSLLATMNTQQDKTRTKNMLRSKR